MIYPKSNIVYRYILHTYVRWITARYFHQIDYNKIEVDDNRSILLIANHFSAWDTLVLFYINRKLFKKRFHTMVLETTMLKEPMLKYGGTFSVNKNSKSLIQSLSFAAKLVDDPDNLVLIYPQGKLYSNMVSKVVFEKGVIHIMKKASGKFNLVFATTFIENFENFKPLANVHLKTADQQFFTNIDELQNAYQQHYTTARQKHTQTVKQ